MNVLHLLPMNKLSGAERMGLLICKHMTDVNSYIITGGDDLASVFKKEGIQASHLNFSIKQLPQLMKRLNQYIAEKQIDIIHAHDNTASLCAYLTKKRYGLKVKVVSHIHNCYPWLESNSIHKYIDRFIRPKYDFNLACGKIVYDYYEQYAPYLNKHKVSILSNAIDMEIIENTSKQQLEKMKKEFNLSSNQIIIGYIGRLSEQKGMIPFIKKLGNYKEQFNNCKFLIVGSGEQELEIKNLVKELELEELFIFTGFQSNVYPFYQLIDIFFLPSLYEGLPMVLLEAVGSGVPTISMDVGSISEVIINNKNGVLIPARDYEKFLMQLVRLCNDVNTRKLYKQNCKLIIKEKFSISLYLDKLFNIYNDLVKEI